MTQEEFNSLLKELVQKEAIDEWQKYAKSYFNRMIKSMEISYRRMASLKN